MKAPSILPFLSLSLMLSLITLINAAALFPRNDTFLPPTSNKGYVSGAYFTNWGIYAKAYAPSHLPASKLTHVFYAFADVAPSGEIRLVDEYADLQKVFEPSAAIKPEPQDHSAPQGQGQGQGQQVHGCIEQLHLLKKQNRHLKVLLSIGGWNFREDFAGPASSETGRKTFARSAGAMVRELGFDGVDLDWEYPETTAQGNDLLLLLKEIRAELPPPYLLTAATSLNSKYYNNLPLSTIHHPLDYINLMAYDYSGPWSTVASHASNLYPSPDSPISTHPSLTAYRRSGIPPGKLILGMPLYGRAFSNTDGPGKPFSSVPAGTEDNSGVIPYHDLPRAGEKVFFDEKVGASWSFDASKQEMVSFDNVEVVRLKGAFIREGGLAGGMWWEVSGDKEVGEGSLVDVLVDALGGTAALDKSENRIAYPESKYVNLHD